MFSTTSKTFPPAHPPPSHQTNWSCFTKIDNYTDLTSTIKRLKSPIPSLGFVMLKKSLENTNIRNPDSKLKNNVINMHNNWLYLLNECKKRLVDYFVSRLCICDTYCVSLWNSGHLRLFNIVEYCQIWFQYEQLRSTACDEQDFVRLFVIPSCNFPVRIISCCRLDKGIRKNNLYSY